MGTNLKVVHEAEAQRQHVRLKLPLQVSIGDRTYKVVDWSVAGFGMEGLVPTPAVGDLLDVRLIFRFSEFQFTLPMRVEVRHASAATGRLSCRFVDVTPGQLSLLQLIVGAYVSGEVVGADDLLETTKRNMFVAPRKMPPPDRPRGRLGTLTQGLRRAVGAGALLLGALAVLCYSALAIYAHAFVTDGKGVVISPEVQLARAYVSGTVTPHTATKGQRVAAKELIAIIQTPDGSTKPVESDCDCLVANEPLPKGTFVPRGTIIARLVPPQARTQVEAHIPLERLDGIEPGQRVRIEIYGGQTPVWGSIDRVDRHTPIDGTSGVGDSSYGVILINPDLPLPAAAVGEPVALQIHLLTTLQIHLLTWLQHWASLTIAALEPQS